MNQLHKKQNGFTIVELLIVIVIIGILAAITIVAYNGIQDRARVSSVNSALSQSAKKLKLFQVDNPDTYPAAAGTNGIDNLAALGITNTSDVTYQYSSSANTYCLTATNGTTSYKISSTSTTATVGGCAGHGVGGVAAITNLMPNPSIETGTSTYGIGGVAVASSADWANNGTYSLKLTPTGATSDSYTNIGGDTGAIRLGMQAGNTYTVSATINLLAPQAGTLQPSRARTIRLFTKVGAGAYVETGPTAAPNSAGATRLTYTFTVPSGATEAFIRLYNGSNSTTDLVYWDSIMLTAGSNTYNYADGSSANWIWNGTANNSTSTGPAS
jgi:prepilin-type N-terminal cleavage/methylation domain-containing protein